MQRETDLYGPVKALFEQQGYVVKGEVGAADMVARKGDEPPVIVELKLKFALALYHQAVARLAMTDRVYIAVARPTGKAARRALKDNRAMCRRLGIGLITVRPRDGHVEILCEPGDAAPRKSPKKARALMKSFDRLTGDPNDGGATRHGIVTGYRQDALRCAAFLAENGPGRGALVAKSAGVPVATRIMADNHYGWFERLDRGIYGLTDIGQAALVHWAYSWEDEMED
jgi:hypothetical protein